MLDLRTSTLNFFDFFHLLWPKTSFQRRRSGIFVHLSKTMACMSRNHILFRKNSFMDQEVIPLLQENKLPHENLNHSLRYSQQEVFQGSWAAGQLEGTAAALCQFLSYLMIHILPNSSKQNFNVLIWPSLHVQCLPCRLEPRCISLSFPCKCMMK